MNEAILLVMADAFDRDAQGSDEAQGAALSPTEREYHRGRRNGYADCARRLRAIVEADPAPKSAQRSADAHHGR